MRPLSEPRMMKSRDAPAQLPGEGCRGQRDRWRARARAHAHTPRPSSPAVPAPRLLARATPHPGSRRAAALTDTTLAGGRERTCEPEGGQAADASKRVVHQDGGQLAMFVGAHELQHAAARNDQLLGLGRREVAVNGALQGVWGGGCAVDCAAVLGPGAGARWRGVVGGGGGSGCCWGTRLPPSSPAQKQVERVGHSLATPLREPIRPAGAWCSRWRSSTRHPRAGAPPSEHGRSPAMRRQHTQPTAARGPGLLTVMPEALLSMRLYKYILACWQEGWGGAAR
jgi:hypothetical protein